MNDAFKQWGGRFEKPTNLSVAAFSASVHVDQRLALEDIAGSIAHARMLGAVGVISVADSQAIISGLEAIREEIRAGQMQWRPDLEDVHTNIEVRLRERIGEPAGRLHTGRSRNDQVALDLRLFVRSQCQAAVGRIQLLQHALLELAATNESVALPGYTHLQRAQPVLFAHHLLAYFEMLERDAERFSQTRSRADVMPLGSGALAGSAYPIDREMVARELGFASISRNSLDAVADRDFIVDFIGAAALTMVHLSRWSEEIVIWSSAEFGFLELDDGFATGSSMMPQKKNPDVAELVRGKTARVSGDLSAILGLLKGLPLSYNRDLQEDKVVLFDAVDQLLPSLEVFAAMVSSLHVQADAMSAAAADWYLLATDIADALVRKGVPFRRAHEAVGKIVRLVAAGRSPESLSLADYQAVAPEFGPEILYVDWHASLAARDVPGGTAPARVRIALAEAKRRLEAAGYGATSPQ